MDTGIYQYFLEVEKNKNISRAAEQCFISQPTLTYHIKKMEQQLGFSIFQVENHKIYPTPMGKIFLDTVRRILQVERETLETIEKYKVQNLQNFRICTDNHLRDPVIDAVIPKFQELYPNLQISVIASDTNIALEMLLKQQIHVGIFPVLDELPSNIEHMLLKVNEYKLVLAQNHPLSTLFEKEGVKLQLLRNETFIFNRNYSLIGKMQMQILQRYHLNPKREYNVPYMVQIAQMVFNGEGISFLPDYMISRCGFSLAAYSFDPPWYFRHILAWHESTSMKRYHPALFQLLESMF